jgi:hypothetical protein
MTKPSVPVPFCPSLPGGPQALAGALPWRVFLVICPPIAGCGQTSVWLAGLVTKPPWPPAPLLLLLPLVLPRGRPAWQGPAAPPVPPPAHTPPARQPATHARTPPGPAHCLPAPTHPSLPHLCAGTGDGICHVYLHKEEETGGFLK